MSNPCLSCGACCAFFRASFHWLETTAAPDGVTPAELTLPVSKHLVAMRGTDRSSPRCVALEGDIGSSVRCSIYERRASPCRNFQASWVGGQHNERCDRARAVHGLPPLPPPAVMVQPAPGERAPQPPTMVEFGVGPAQAPVPEDLLPL